MRPSLPDYHTHTARCGHATGEAADYVQQAQNRGLIALGVADHLPLLHGPDPELAMDISELDQYVDEIEELKKRHPGYVLLGIEADYRPDTISQVEELVRSYPFDYVIGSVHFLNGWGFDDPRHLEGFENRDIDDIYRGYFELVEQAALSGVFDVLAHLDLVKKFGHRASRSFDDFLDHVCDVVAQGGCVVEINTSGLRKPVGEIYPSLELLQRLEARGVPITFGSDAHRPDDVGQGFEQAVSLARVAGYRSYCRFVPEPDGPRAARRAESLDASIGAARPGR